MAGFSIIGMSIPTEIASDAGIQFKTNIDPAAAEIASPGSAATYSPTLDPGTSYVLKINMCNQDSTDYYVGISVDGDIVESNILLKGNTSFVREPLFLGPSDTVDFSVSVTQQ